MYQTQQHWVIDTLHCCYIKKFNWTVAQQNAFKIYLHERTVMVDPGDVPKEAYTLDLDTQILLTL